MRSTKVYVDRGKRNVDVEKVKRRWGGDSRVRRVCVMLNAACIAMFLSRGLGVD